MKTTTFWVTNTSKMNVSIADLNLTIKAFSSVNLLDAKHYHYTLEQLEQSRAQGSLAAKKDKLVIRNISPQINKSSIPYVKEAIVPSRARSVLKITEEHYEELNISDEQFADENAETAELDRKPILAKDDRHVTAKASK